jgi:hypothetical protein
MLVVVGTTTASVGFLADATAFAHGFLSALVADAMKIS